MTRTLYRVTQPRTRVVEYERLVWADSPEDAEEDSPAQPSAHPPDKVRP